MNSDVHSAILRGRWQIRATTRPILPEAQRTTAQNLKPHARRRTATATVHDGTEAGLLLTTNSISSGSLVSKLEAHTHRLSWYVGSCLRRGTPLALQRNAREEHPSVRPSHGNKVLGGIEKKCSGGNDKQEPPWGTVAFHDMQSSRKFAAALFTSDVLDCGLQRLLKATPCR